MTGDELKFDSYKVAHDLPPLEMVTWTFHDKPTNPPTVRTTAVCILSPNGAVFTGVSGCSELDVFSKKDGFQRAFGRARQRYVQYVRPLHLMDDGVQPDLRVKMEADIKDIGRWIANHAFEMKLRFIKQVYLNRVMLGKVPDPTP